MTENSSVDIAIIGMACVLPGAKDANSYWQNILAKRCFINDAPPEWVEGYYDPESPDLDRIYTKKVGLLGDLAEFDPLEFGIVPNALSASEPDHFLALKMAARAIEHAGYGDKPFDNAGTGIVLGRGATPNRGVANGLLSSLALNQITDIIKQLLPEADADTILELRKSLMKSLFPLVPEAAPGLVSNVAVGRIANRLDLQGPTYLIDAACASTLIAAELAIKELRSGSSNVMLAGGVQASMPPQVYMLFCQLKALSRNGAMPFSQNADGTILSEGCGFLVMKRLPDAVAAGDTIYAVLKSAGVASDGRAQGLLTPRMEGQKLAVERAYELAGMDPQTIGLIECHGTGIPVGDRTEIQTLRNVFGSTEQAVPDLAIGSVKSMIGHCIPAAGISSLIKMALSLHHKILPPTICEEVSVDLNLANSPLYVNTEARPWIHGDLENPRRAACNAFGFGGINAHVILEEYIAPVEQQISGFPFPTELLTLSAATPQKLIGAVEELVKTLAARADATLAGVALHLSQKPAQECRLAILATDLPDLKEKLQTAAAKIAEGKKKRLQTRTGIYLDLGGEQRIKGKTAFLFPGQGSQYPNMLADLCMIFPEIRREFDLSDAAFRGIWETLPSQYVFPPPTGLTEATRTMLMDKFLSIDVAMETIFTANIALFRLLRSFGVPCDMMLGHSTGEYTVLAASGAVKVPEAKDQIELKRRLNRFYRDMNTAESVPRGSLVVVGAVDPKVLEEKVNAYGGKVYVAMDNCPHQKILFGTPEDIAELAEIFKGLGGLCQILPFNYAYHTPLLEPMKEELLKFYDELPLGTPDYRVFSCASMGEFSPEPAAVRELSVSQWYSSVRFKETIEKLYAEENVRFFIEVGPSAVLTSFVEDSLRKKEFLAVASNDRVRSGLDQLQRLLAQLFCRGFELDFAPLYRSRKVTSFDPAGPDPKVRKHSKANRKLDVAMPVISLQDDVVQATRAKVGLGRDKTNGTHRAKEPVAASASAPEIQLSNGDSEVEVYRNSGRSMQDIVVAHEELMQEFILNQQRCMETLLVAAQDGALVEEEV